MRPTADRLLVLRLVRSAALAALVACHAAEPPPEPAPPVTCIPVEIGTATDVVQLTGPVRPPPEGDALVMAAVTSTIVAVRVREGDAVLAGQPLVQLDDRTFADTARAAEADLATARSALANADAVRSRKQTLLAEGIVSQADAGAALATAEAAHASVDAAQARLDAARADVARASVPSPITGQVARVLVKVGQAVDPTTQLVEVVDPSRLELVAAAPAEILARVHADQAAEVKVGDVEVLGTVGAVSPGVAPDSGLGTVRLLLPGSSAPIGALGSADVTVAIRTGALFLPAEAIRADLQQGHVVVVCDGSVARVQQVELGPRSPSGEVEVTSGLQATERVVSDGGAGLATGDPLVPPQETDGG